jgi:hypothetical protein
VIHYGRCGLYKALLKVTWKLETAWVQVEVDGAYRTGSWGPYLRIPTQRPATAYHSHPRRFSRSDRIERSSFVGLTFV